jgi:sporulation protein YabP
MEKTINTLSKDKKEITYNENITLANRRSLHIDGIIEIISTSENNLNMKMKDTFLNIIGENIHITKLDISTGILEAEGNFINIKYGKNSNILKRFFK